MNSPGTVLLTVGHGTLDETQLGDLIVGCGIERVIDVRRHPDDRANAAAALPVLERIAEKRGFGYRWDERLGGRRELSPEERATSPDSFWKVPQFRAYAAWTRGPEFRAGLEQLLEELRGARTAVLCVETVWWRCHRRLVADIVQMESSVPVLHLHHDGRRRPHPVSQGARRRDDGLLVWDGVHGSRVR
ncbi:DUF488 domain-containing protein [Ornithinimicrobium avium]|uniref:DUF488 domain-containing protein n=1 Tax=Ornithinimicrobium avium TaxID=2283195 RepID=A0A345NKJ3_9MICO|nr:DUF488 domain-containing protein [Ornithinimicrobium avium]AXH95551.1 DUF488 domain-containing protein [Ornithinimicrobium avium]